MVTENGQVFVLHCKLSLSNTSILLFFKYKQKFRFKLNKFNSKRALKLDTIYNLKMLEMNHFNLLEGVLYDLGEFM